ncbi:MAG TPA: efflux RND transporter periplasmic adaptor subunit [Pseudolabrys sp.]|nr:efflux RND transporter periplasmic adaptor subunit [Pseudolabrys sp.]
MHRLANTIMTQLPLRSWASASNVATAIAALIVGTWLAVAATTHAQRTENAAIPDEASQGRRDGALYYPTAKQWSALTTAPVTNVIFRTERLTEGKISVDEDRSTLVFSPYSGRVTRLLAKPGDTVKAGQPLFVVEAPDMVQAQNDFISAISNLNKARSALELARIVEQQNKTLYDSHAGPLRDLQTSQATARAAENDVRSAQTTLEVSRNRLRILGMTDDEITKFGDTGAVSPHMTIYSPIAGTVIQRKVGPGQYINTSSQNTNASDPSFVIGDLSTVWLIAYVREADAPNVHVGQALHFTVLAYPDRVFSANISYVATSLDTGTRRLLVRATIDNSKYLLRPEMFASVNILTGEGDSSPAIPSEAIIYDGKTTHVWVTRGDKSVERRDIKTGLSSGQMIQVTDGLRIGESVVSKGSLFVDRAAAGS